MIINNYILENFRNIENCEIEPCDNMNVICGENAQGKTNLIEGIWLFTGAKSFRGSKDREFINFNKESCLLETNFKSEGIEKQAKIIISEKKELFLNGKKIKKSSDFAGNINAIVFSPIDLRLVTDGPSVRRRFLDIAIGQLYPSYIEILKNYLRAVSQRNNIIKELKYDSTVSVMLDVFENEIVANGIRIIELRKRYIEKLEEFLPLIYSGISSGKEKLEIKYIHENKDDLKEKLIFSRKEDMFSAVTSIGPHRDDIIFNINGNNARNFASQGQKRSIALSLKLAEAEVIRKKVGECPLCLMDDVMSELDPNRQNFVLNHVKEMQVFLTCCDPQNVKNLKAGKIFSVEQGMVK
ncbi:MAG: DNA replication/repair protein RecF [Clostridia bacterium]|nr:DNA replication/repair protein RecF [Clostridia bacterium]